MHRARRPGADPVRRARAVSPLGRGLVPAIAWRVMAAVTLLAACQLAVGQTDADTPPRSSVADVVGLTVCVIDADIRTAAIVQLQAGASEADARAAVQASMPDATYRAQAERLVAEVYRAKPASLRAHVADRLQRCASAAARRVNPAAADGCYQLTRFANDFFAARAAGMPLEATVASLREMARTSGLSVDGEQRLAKLAASAYATTVEPSQFRAGLFFHCVVPGNPPR